MEEQNIRWQPFTQASQLNIEYDIGDIVEVWGKTEDLLENWRKACIRNKRDGLFLVHYEGYDNEFDTIVPAIRIRPLNTQSALKVEDFVRTEIAYPQQLSEWSNSERAKTHLAKIANLAELLCARVDPVEEKAVLIGNEKSVARGKLYLEIVFENEITAHEMERKRRQEALTAPPPQTEEPDNAIEGTRLEWAKWITCRSHDSD